MWQTVYQQQFDIMERLAVDGGWLYRNRFVVGAASQNPQDFVWAVTLAFVPEVAAPPPPVEEARNKTSR